MKRCSHCHEHKDISLFYRDKNRKDGHAAECITCQKKRKLKYNKVAVEKRARERAAINHKNLKPVCCWPASLI